MKALSYLETLPQLVESLLYQSQFFQIALNLLDFRLSSYNLLCHNDVVILLQRY